jgi:hypothetical protein
MVVSLSAILGDQWVEDDGVSMAIPKTESRKIKIYQDERSFRASRAQQQQRRVRASVY